MHLTQLKIVGEAYSKSKHGLNNIDNGIRIGKHIYSSTSPLLDEHLGKHSKAIHDNVMHGISKYDDIKNSVVEHHDNLYIDYTNVTHKLF